MKRKLVFKTPSFWVTIWAIAFLTYGEIKGISLPWFTALTPILGGAVVVYIGGNKAVDFKHGPEMEDEKQGE